MQSSSGDPSPSPPPGPAAAVDLTHVQGLLQASKQAKDHIMEVVSICSQCANSKGSGEGLRKLALTVKALLEGAAQRLAKSSEEVETNVSYTRDDGDNLFIPEESRHVEESLLSVLNEKYQKIINTRKANEVKWKTLAESAATETKGYKTKLESCEEKLKKQKKNLSSLRRDLDNVIVDLRIANERCQKAESRVKTLEEKLKFVKAKSNSQTAKLKRRLANMNKENNQTSLENEKLKCRLVNAKKRYAEVKSAANAIAKSYQKTLKKLESEGTCSAFESQTETPKRVDEVPLSGPGDGEPEVAKMPDSTKEEKVSESD
mmetsp:Transcript_18313/g.44950  ORF Transcript_18313/g.44950 Transcript_18313/m.44950 type:complete len:318 (-) Transcript_18313:176-1129(-)